MGGVVLYVVHLTSLKCCPCATVKPGIMKLNCNYLQLNTWRESGCYYTGVPKYSSVKFKGEYLTNSVLIKCVDGALYVIHLTIINARSQNFARTGKKFRHISAFYALLLCYTETRKYKDELRLFTTQLLAREQMLFTL